MILKKSFLKKIIKSRLYANILIKMITKIRTKLFAIIKKILLFYITGKDIYQMLLIIIFFLLFYI